MNSKDPTPEEILLAVKESGYLMEQEVASTIESHDFHVFTNQAFEDIDEHKSREIDVRAFKSIYSNFDTKIGVIIEILCEVKNNTSPIVFITRNKNLIDRDRTPEEYIFPVKKYEVPISKTRSELKSPFSIFELNKKHFEFENEYKAVQFCKIIHNKGKWKTSQEEIYNSLFIPLVKYLTSRIENTKSNYELKYAWLFFPMIVLKSKIYYIDSTSKNTIPLEAGYVRYVRELKSNTIEGKYAIDFVTQSYLSTFINEKITPFTDEVVKIAEQFPEIFCDQYYYKKNRKV